MTFASSNPLCPGSQLISNRARPQPIMAFLACLAHDFQSYTGLCGQGGGQGHRHTSPAAPKSIQIFLTNSFNLAARQSRTDV
jgi:hypothetical protein